MGDNGERQESGIKGRKKPPAETGRGLYGSNPYFTLSTLEAGTKDAPSLVTDQD